MSEKDTKNHDVTGGQGIIMPLQDDWMEARQRAKERLQKKKEEEWTE